MLMLLWAIQIEVDSGTWLSPVLMLGGLMIGVQLSQASLHFKATKDEPTEDWQTSTSTRAVLARVDRLRWHSRMIFYPVVVRFRTCNVRTATNATHRVRG